MRLRRYKLSTKQLIGIAFFECRNNKCSSCRFQTPNGEICPFRMNKSKDNDVESLLSECTEIANDIKEENFLRIVRLVREYMDIFEDETISLKFTNKGVHVISQNCNIINEFEYK